MGKSYTTDDKFAVFCIGINYVMALIRWFQTEHHSFWHGFKELIWAIVPLVNITYVWDWWSAFFGGVVYYLIVPVFSVLIGPILLVGLLFQLCIFPFLYLRKNLHIGKKSRAFNIVYASFYVLLLISSCISLLVPLAVNTHDSAVIYYSIFPTIYLGGIVFVIGLFAQKRGKKEKCNQ